MISKVSNNVSFGQLKIADYKTKERLEKTMQQDVDLNALIQKSLAGIHIESGDDLVILSSKHCPENGFMHGSPEGYKLTLKTPDNAEIGTTFIASGFQLREDIAYSFNKLISAVKDNKNSTTIKDCGLDQYM